MMKCFSTAVMLCLMMHPAIANEAIGQVKTATGEAHIARGSEKLPAEPGLFLEQADRLITGADGSLGVTFIDNTRFSAGPNSVINLKRFRFNSTTHEGAFSSKVEKGTLAVVSGKLAKRSPDAITVETPTAILGVRGTQFLVRVGE